VKLRMMEGFVRLQGRCRQFTSVVRASPKGIASIGLQDRSRHKKIARTAAWDGNITS